jgi:hypothetical protein
MNPNHRKRNAQPVNTVNHHRKSEAAKTHMNGCAGFRSAMNGIEILYRPDWYISNKKGGKKEDASKVMSSPGGTSSGTFGKQTSMRAFVLPAMSANEKDHFQTWPHSMMYCPIQMGSLTCPKQNMMR